MGKAKIIDGKATALMIRKELSEEVKELKDKYDLVPGLATVLVGDDPASEYYVNSKIKACREMGIYSEIIKINKNADCREGIEAVSCLRKNPKIHGIHVQMPLPENWPVAKMIEEIGQQKDVDGFHSGNIGALWKGENAFIPCTPKGIMELLKRYEVKLKGKEAVVIGRSMLVGKPIAALLLRGHATVTICHSRTQDLSAVCCRADILIAAAGRPEMVKADWIKEGAVVIDVGINRIERDGKKKLVGDVAFDEVVEKAGMITPVPGGVGPMTIAMLLANTIESAKNTINNIEV